MVLTPRPVGARNRQIAELRRLIGRRSSRSETIVIEGARTVGEALDEGFVVDTVVVPEGWGADAAVARVLERLGKVAVNDRPDGLQIPADAYQRLAPSISPQPILALLHRPVQTLPDPLPVDAVIIVLVSINDPGNVGTLVRVADAVGADAVLVVGGADPWGPKAVRASAGSVLRVRIVQCDLTDEPLADLRQRGLTVIGTSLVAGEPHDEGIMTPPVAIVLGSEAHGLDPVVEPQIDRWVRIKMPGRAESLNVAMAGTLLAFETRRTSS